MRPDSRPPRNWPTTPISTEYGRSVPRAVVLEGLYWLTVLGAIGAAGGPMYTANTSDITLIRRNKDGIRDGGSSGELASVSVRKTASYRQKRRSLTLVTPPRESEVSMMPR